VSGQEIERMQLGLLAIAERARVEADAGAPAGMVARYVDMETRHVLGGHDGSDGTRCEICITASVSC
jgi:hypothetical protein